MAYIDKALNALQVQNLLESVGDNPRNRAMLLVAVKQALRPSEVVKLRVSDIDLPNAKLRVARLKKSETGYHDLSATEITALRAWLAVREDPSNALFTSRNGGALDVKSYFRMYRAAAERAGLPKNLQHPHCLRHTAAVLLLKDGASLPEVQTYLGHKSLASTGHYLKTSLQQASAAAAKAFGGKF